MTKLFKSNLTAQWGRVGATALLLAMAGCVSIPADHDVLSQRDMASAQLAANIKLARDGWPEAQWWTRYDDPQLNRLITQALKEGPTLQVAAARTGSARAALSVDASAGGINVDFTADSNRQRYSANGFFPPPIGGSYYTETTPQVVANYDFDWWGKHKAAISAALGEVNARQADYAQAEQTLAAEVAQSYFTLQGDWTRLDNLQHMQALQTELVADKAKRIANGIASSDAERLAEVDLGNLKQQKTQLETHIAHEREALRALLGADSQALTDLGPHPLPELPPALPATLGIELLARRPDLQAARWQVEASLDRIEATQATFYPDVNLMASFGSDVITLDKLFSLASRTLYLGPTVTLPLFDSGRLKARLGVARAERNELIADYNQSVVNAVREVAQAGVSLQGLQKQIDEQALTVAASKAVLHSAQARYKQGLADRAGLLNAELAVSRQ
ncbi:MAG TPA: efflux transporter outer membrane subunit, partial [Burkholderiaceae bacterium]|nr:efflux transporter outer membrane subunit [Burkholderiaceae bacterium]